MSISSNQDPYIITTTLDCDDDGGVQLNSTTPTPFYIVLPPNSLSTGFSITITDMAGNTMTKTTTKDNTIERSKITVMPGIEFIPDLSGGGSRTANCYVVSTPGKYIMSVGSKGNTSSSDLSPQSVEILWTQVSASSSSVSNDDVIKNVLLNETAKTVSFEYTGTPGNVLLAVEDDYGDIIWSWHIWGSPVDFTLAENQQTQLLSGVSATRLDIIIIRFSTSSRTSRAESGSHILFLYHRQLNNYLEGP